MLDGRPVDPEAGKKVNNGMILESAAELRIAEEDMDDEARLENDILGGIAPRPVSKQKSETAEEAGSELTHGSSVAMAGSVTAAMRRRRQAASSVSADESAFEIVDEILSPSRDSGRCDPIGSAFYQEGDVTASLRGSSALHASLTLQGLDDDEDCARGVDARMRSRHDSGDYPVRDSAPSPAVRGSGQRLSGRRGPGMDVSMSFDCDPSQGQGLRPRTAASSLSVGKPFGCVPGSPAILAASPRQRNGSRPQSAASVGSSGSTPRHHDRSAANAAPFKVSMEKRTFCGAEPDDSTPSKLGVPLKGAAGGKSIVHLDIVKRPTGNFMIAEEGDDEDDGAFRPAGLPSTAGDDDSDAEDIGVTHAARHRLMHASSTAGTANSVTSNLKARQQILQKLKTTGSKQTGYAEESAEAGRAVSPGAGRVPRATTPSRNPHLSAAGSPRVEMGIAERGTARKGSRASQSECELESLEGSPPRLAAVSVSATKARGAIPKVTQSSKVSLVSCECGTGGIITVCVVLLTGGYVPGFQPGRQPRCDRQVGAGHELRGRGGRRQ
jgi:hypothetical protein